MALPFLQTANQIPNVRALKVTAEPPSSLVADHVQKRCDQRPGVHGVEKPFVSVEAVVEHGGWAKAAGVCTRQQARVWGFFLGHLGRILLGLVILDFGLGYYGHWTL
ncbi:hypothetical protein ES288_A02G087900v1, partial [Gossypium darwinii]